MLRAAKIGYLIARNCGSATTSLLSATANPANARSGAKEAVRVAVVTPELHRRGGTERGNAEVVARLAEKAAVCLYAHHWEPDGTPNICFHRVPVLPWPGLLRFLSFYASATLAVRAGARRHGGYQAVYSPGANCHEVHVSSAWFCQARQLELFRSGRHRPSPATWMDWLKLAHRWSYAAAVARVERAFYARPGLRRVVTQSHLLARDLQHFYGLSPERTIVAHGGVNCETFAPELRGALRQRARAELGLADAEFVFFFIGNNWLIKGLYHVIRALPHVPGVRVMVVGLGAERPESWMAFSRTMGVADRITCLPKRPDIIYYYAAADALLAPSVYDTFPLMPMEAMACGLPVILSRNTGVAEIVRPEDCLVVENIEAPAELAAAMNRMAADCELRARLAANGLVLARHNRWDRIYQAIAEELLAEGEEQHSAAA
jgi:glycosyltransferase involved in cell wall biosynthesis